MGPVVMQVNWPMVEYGDFWMLFKRTAHAARGLFLAGKTLRILPGIVEWGGR